MFRNTSVKKALFLVVALLAVTTVVLAACDGGFKPVSMPSNSDEVVSNGGIAVQYGEWLYYVNGYTSDVNADNSYADVKDAPRIGSVVRIKMSEIEKLFSILDDKDLTSTSAKNEKIAKAVRGEVEGISGAETVVPKIYYSGNTNADSKQFNGIYIFDNRIYVTTPNDELTAGGEALTSQLVLTSFKLDGSDMQRHFVFTSNSAQIWLGKVGDNLVATYIMNNTLYHLDVKSGASSEVTINGEDSKPGVANTVKSVTWDIAGKNIFFLDKFGSICKLAFGAKNYDVIVSNDSFVDHGDHIEDGTITYTIKTVNNGEVYYTVADSTNQKPSDAVIYWASAASKDNVALKTNYDGAIGWKQGKMVYSKSEGDFYGIYVVTGDGTGDNKPAVVLSPKHNSSPITIDRIEGDVLYYTANSVSYTLDLNEADNSKAGVPFAKSPSSTGWSTPDYITVGDVHYVITLGSGTISVVKFDVKEKTNSSSVSLLLTAKPVEE